MKDPPLIRNREELMLLSVLAKKIPGGPYCKDTLRKWCTEGRRRDKKDSASVVMMEYTPGPHGFLSSINAYWRFISALRRNK